MNPCGVFVGADTALGKRGARKSECELKAELDLTLTHLIAEYDGLLRIWKNRRCFGYRRSRYETGWFDRRTIHFLLRQRWPIALRELKTNVKMRIDPLTRFVVRGTLFPDDT